MAVPKVVVVVAARLNSQRLPLKITEPIDFETGSRMLEEVCSQVSWIKLPIVITRPLSELGTDLNEFGILIPAYIESFGPDEDLIKRYLLASEGYDHVVRVTGDCPFLDPWAARCTIHTHLKGGYDLTMDDAEGRGVQVYTRALLERMDREDLSSYEREHLDAWPIGLKRVGPDRLRIHWMKFSIDTQAELELARRRVTL